ncbi:MAG: acyl carrier protein, partial [Acidobacteriaceae bacterium]
MPLDHERLKRCFTSTFPAAGDSEIETARIDDMPGWDSLRGVTLLAVLDEEFGLQLDLEELLALGSFDAIREYLEQHSVHK